MPTLLATANPVLRPRSSATAPSLRPATDSTVPSPEPLSTTVLVREHNPASPARLSRHAVTRSRLW